MRRHEEGIVLPELRVGRVLQPDDAPSNENVVLLFHGSRMG